MKKLLLALLFIGGCSLQASSAVDVRLISEEYDEGYGHIKYEVLCPADVASDSWRSVDFYGPITFEGNIGYVFPSKEALLEYEYSRSCRDEGDGDGTGPENSEE